MTKTTEDLKRAMYEYFEVARSNSARPNLFSLFEKSLEEYLERLRSESAVQAERLGLTGQTCDILRDAYAHQQGLTHAACVESREVWSENYGLKARVRELESSNARGHAASLQDQAELQSLREQRDELRNKLQAFEFANKSAGELLIDSRAKVKAQRQSIGKLKNERDNAQHALKVKDSKLQKALEELSEARKLLGATSVQSVAENAAGDECGGVTAINELDAIEAFVNASIAGFAKFDRENGIK